jgi:hypothetical protein
MTNDTETILKNFIDRVRASFSDSLILLIHNSIGETVVILSFLSAIYKRHGCKIAIIIRPEHDYIVKNFHNAGIISAVYLIETPVIRAIAEINRHKNSLLPGHIFDTWPKNYLDGILYKGLDLFGATNGQRGLNLLDIYRFMFDLPLEFPPDSLSFPKSNVVTSQILEKLKLNDPSALLFPGNNTNCSIPFRLWDQIVRELRRGGYRVLVNLKGASIYDRRLEKLECEYINLDIEQALCVSSHVSRVISGANGMVVYLLASQATHTLDVMLPTEKICENGAPKNIPSVLGSHYATMPEIATKNQKFYEWQIIDDDYESVASAIVEKNLEHKSNIGIHNYKNYFSSVNAPES